MVGRDCKIAVGSDGQWSITVKQPRPSTATNLPITVNSRASKSTQMFYLTKGQTTFNENYNGSGYVDLFLYDSNGNIIEDLGQIGQSTRNNEKTTYISKDGIYFIKGICGDISGEKYYNNDGVWQVSISQ